MHASNSMVRMVDTVMIDRCGARARAHTHGHAHEPAGQLGESVPLLSTLVQLLTAADLKDMVEGASPFIVFAPMDDAFNAVGSTTAPADRCCTHKAAQHPPLSRGVPEALSTEL